MSMMFGIKTLGGIEDEVCRLVESSHTELVTKCNKLLNQLLLSIVANSEKLKSEGIEDEVCTLVESSHAELVTKCNKLLNQILLSIVSKSERLKTDLKSYIDTVRNGENRAPGERQKWTERKERFARNVKKEEEDEDSYSPRNGSKGFDTNFLSEQFSPVKKPKRTKNPLVDSNEDEPDKDEEYSLPLKAEHLDPEIKDNIQGNVISNMNFKSDGKHIYCNECSYKTTKKAHMNHHVKGVHLKIKDFKCYVCTFATGSKSNLQTHLKGQHGIVE